MRNLFFTLSIFYSFFVLPQSNKRDSLLKLVTNSKEDTNLVNNLGKLARIYRNSNMDSSRIFCERAMEISKKINFTTGKIQSLIVLGFLNQRQGEKDLALKNYEEALALAIASKNKNEEARALGSIGDLFFDQQKIPEAMEKYIMALNMFETLGVKDSRMNSLYGKLGQLNFMQGNVKRSLEYLNSGLALCIELKENVSIAYSHIYIGNIYGDTRQYDSSTVHYLKAYDILIKEDDKSALTAVISNIAQNYNELGNFNKAIEYFNLALKGTIVMKDRDAEANTLINLGSAYCNIKNYEKAIDYFNKAIRISNEIKSGNNLKNVYRSLGYTFFQKGEYKTAYSFLEKHLIIKDSLFSEESQSQIAEMETKYQSEKKELQIKNLEKDKELKASEIKKERILKYAGFGGLFAALLIGVLLTIGLINKRKDNRLIRKQKEEVEIKSKEIELQKHILLEKNNEITDSITYAKRLQDAILPSAKAVNEMLTDNFILYKPKDIVAGDFYWFEKVNSLVLFAAADSTGHGVPGALVSVICSNALNRSVLEFGITDPGKILDKTRELVISTFNKSQENVKDGMDISLCCINMKTLELLWAGANNPLLYVSDGNLYEVKGDKQPVSNYDTQNKFTTHHIQLKKGDIIYVYSDGYADQFGGPKGKKFRSKQLNDILLTNSHELMSVQKQMLNSSFEEWKGQLEQIDDVCVIGVKV